MVAGTRTAILRAAVHFAHAANADGLAHVDVARDGCRADVEPASIETLDVYDKIT